MKPTGITRNFGKINKIPAFKNLALKWASGFEVASLLDSNDYQNDPYHRYELLIGARPLESLSIQSPADGNAFEHLSAFREQNPDAWLFGFLSYDLKNHIERLSSIHPDGIGLPELHFFCPAYVLAIENGELWIRSRLESPDEILQQILGSELSGEAPIRWIGELQPRMPRIRYLDTIERIRQHIAAGDVYEMNLCQEFYAHDCDLDPALLFAHLNRLSRAPFACFYRLADRYLLCASPERFLQKEGDRLRSQPIKGTRPRARDAAEDRALAEELSRSPKDRAEHIMIVDLVRNDLAKSCLPGTVQVDELFGIYTFPTVHQMISTISGRIDPQYTWIDAIRNAFPMGSMTGAPKVMSMELIEQYELSRRGLYSGAVGYVAPNGDFDFNVVIRSLFYNAPAAYLSFQVGGAIVYDSIPEQEYEECMVKAGAMLKAIGIIYNG